MGALPKSLAGRGHHVMVVSPKYDNYQSAAPTNVRMTYNVFGTDHEVRHPGHVFAEFLPSPDVILFSCC